MCATPSLFIHPVMDTDTGTINVIITTAVVGMVYMYLCFTLHLISLGYMPSSDRDELFGNSVFRFLVFFFFPEPPYSIPQWLN